MTGAVLLASDIDVTVEADLDPDDAPVWNIVGERIALGPLRRDLLPHYHRWRNDFWVQRTYGETLVPASVEERTAWFERAAAGADSLWFTIYERATARPIGVADLFQIERDHGLAWFGMLIGDAGDRGKGYGAETSRLMLDYAFNALNLHVVMLSVDEFNHAGRRAYARAGFRDAGRIRGATLLAGRRYDRILMDCVANEFESPVLRDLLAPERQ